MSDYNENNNKNINIKLWHVLICSVLLISIGVAMGESPYAPLVGLSGVAMPIVFGVIKLNKFIKTKFARSKSTPESSVQSNSRQKFQKGNFTSVNQSNFKDFPDSSPEISSQTHNLPKEPSFFERLRRQVEEQQRIRAENKAIEKAYQKERLKQLKRDKIPYCPRCKSTSLSAQKKGFGIGKAVIGASLTCSALGLVGGNIGACKINVTCLNCGKRFKAGKGGKW